MTMSKSLSNTLILIISILGCLVTLVLLFEHFRPSVDIGCSAVGGNCHTANESIYGHVGPIPTSAFGLAMYLSLIGIALKRRQIFGAFVAEKSSSNSPELKQDESNGVRPEAFPHASEPAGLKPFEILTWSIAAPAAVISVWLQKVSLYDIFSFCPYCMASCIFVLLIFALSSRDLFIGNRKLVGEQKLLVGTFAFIGIMTLFMGLPDFFKQIDAVIHLSYVKPAGPVTTSPTAPPIVTKDMHVIGPDNAPYTLVEFADYQCSHCKKAAIYMSNEMKKEPNKFRLAFRNYPLPMHTWAARAALAAEAAGEQGKFWEMHDLIYAHQEDMDKPDFSQEKFKQFATQLGLDVKKFETDMKSDKMTMRVASDANAAPALEVKQTPTFFVIHGNKPPYRLSGNDQLQIAVEDPDNAAWK